MDPQKLPLEPLIAPSPVSWWPLAPIWWIVLSLLIIVIIGVLIYRFRKILYTAQPKLPVIDFDIRRQAALNELSKLPKPYQQTAGLWLQQINDLLKRLCIVRYPTENAKILIGQAWLNFLDNKCSEAQIKQFPMLVEGEYHPNYYMDDKTIDNLYSAVEKWITHHV